MTWYLDHKTGQITDKETLTTKSLKLFPTRILGKTYRDEAAKYTSKKHKEESK